MALPAPEKIPAEYDFFISYTGKDQAWAEWIAWQLEAAGYKTIIQAWDFKSGGVFPADMHRALQQSARVIGVLSPDYLLSPFCESEWLAAFKDDPTGKTGRLTLVRVAPCETTGLLAGQTYIDLVNKSPDAAKDLLLARLKSDRAKPATEPPHPGTAAKPLGPAPAFPGVVSNNLPQIPPFFGRVDELQQIADALAPEARTWGALIDGPGGMGKTTLAIRAAQLVPPGQFQRILFLSAKDRELDEDGERRLTGFILSGWLEMLNEIAAQLGKSEITKSLEADRARHILAALAAEKALLILDNLESLTKEDRDQLFNFVKRLPPGCKAILTSRRRIGGSGDALILEQLDQTAALQVLADMAKHNRLLAKTTEPERIILFQETGGRPLLLRWVAGQVGRGHCRTVADGVRFLNSAPEGNNPLEFIFGDLLDDFTAGESKVLVALTYFSLPATVKHIAEVGELPEADAESALKTLSNRSLVVPDVEEKNYSLLPMVAGFLRRKRPEAVAETGNQLAKRAYALIMENGYQKHDLFPVLEAAWPMVAPALPIILAEDTERMGRTCDGIQQFLAFTGRWDELLSVMQRGEGRAVAAQKYEMAGWLAYHVGMVHYVRQEADEVLASAGRAQRYWIEANAGDRNHATGICLRGIGHRIKQEHSAAVDAFREALQLNPRLLSDSADVVLDLNYFAAAERAVHNYIAAERDYREALGVASAFGYSEDIATCTGNLASLALEQKDWPKAEGLARAALPLSEKVGGKELIASNCRRIAQALARQDKKTEGLPYAQRAVDIYTQLASPRVERALETLKECEP